ncbi:Dodecaprenyl-phosphate galacturonate synthase [bioreactor metagenome]|uniref:Dodecaprenyl-phosphate galacturonate synthase n=1 Tax=bioreactor metagenome TaxID=1076179 RepID=A0A644VYZ0_9ZZZZ
MNRTGAYKLTVTIPVLNEEDNIPSLIKRLDSLASTCNNFPVCFLFIDDGSKDGSLKIIKDICNKRENYFFLKFERNYGLSAALKAGFDYAQSEFTGYIDADLQVAPEDFSLLIPYINDYEMVMGIRQHRKDSVVKAISSKIANGFRRMMTGDGVEDTGCPLKIIRSSFAKRIPMFNGMHRFLPALLLLQNGKIKQVPVEHHPRVAGVSKFHLFNRLVGPFMDTFAYRWMKKRYINYSVSDNNLG